MAESIYEQIESFKNDLKVKAENSLLNDIPLKLEKCSKFFNDLMTEDFIKWHQWKECRLSKGNQPSQAIFFQPNLDAQLNLDNWIVSEIAESFKPEILSLIEIMKNLKMWFTLVVSPSNTGRSLVCLDELRCTIDDVQTEALNFFDRMTSYEMLRPELVHKIQNYPLNIEYKYELLEKDSLERWAIFFIICQLQIGMISLHRMLQRELMETQGFNSLDPYRTIENQAETLLTGENK